jgi:hypothetical protein
MKTNIKVLIVTHIGFLIDPGYDLTVSSAGFKIF